MNDKTPKPGPRNERELKLFTALNLDGLGLEIGPSYRPAVPKARGFNVEVADHASAEDLRQKYHNVPNALTNIEHVDYVLTAGLYEGIKQPGRYDYILASHVIEHVPDFIQFLKDCETLLTVYGVLTLAVPDKRYCFDAARPTSSLGHVLRVHSRRRTKPDPEDVLDHYLNCVSKNNLYGWHRGYEFDYTQMYDWGLAQQWYRRALDGEYVDVHCWQFTPSTFRLLIADLIELGHVNLHEVVFFDTTDHEFFVSLKKGYESPVDRTALLKSIIVEASQI